MRVLSKTACGFRSNGTVLLQKGETVLDDAALTGSERAFIDAMVLAKIAEKVSEPVPSAPVSETKLKKTKSKAAKAASSRLDVAPPRALRVRRAVAK